MFAPVGARGTGRPATTAGRGAAGGGPPRGAGDVAAPPHGGAGGGRGGAGRGRGDLRARPRRGVVWRRGCARSGARGPPRPAVAGAPSAVDRARRAGFGSPRAARPVAGWARSSPRPWGG